MDDTINRQAAIDAFDCSIEGVPADSVKYVADYAHKMIYRIKNLPSAQPEIIRCKDCKWWDKSEDSSFGYCMAMKHGYWSGHWEISIRRTYKGDFYCADAEPKGEQECTI